MTNIRTKIKNNWQLYLFLLIPVVYIIIFAYVPMFGAQIAFRRYSPRLGIWGSPWAGLAKFRLGLHHLSCGFGRRQRRNARSRDN